MTMSGPRDDAVSLPVRAGLGAIWRAPLRRLAFGTLTVVTPDGRVERYAGARPGPDATIRLNRPGVPWRLLLGGDVGFGEDYAAGLWDTPDLPTLLELGARNLDAIGIDSAATWLGRLASRLRHAGHRNTRRGSRRNIAAHYDLGNDFYRLWLDPSLTYSSAVFAAADQSLAEAQALKYARLADLLEARPGQHVLEIGCGWGGFAMHLARERGCRVTAITVSPAQRDLAARRVRDAGLAERIEVRLQDYRDVAGTYDRVASIEMFEAVGEAYWPIFFRRLRERLKRDGVAALQIITIADDRFERYRRSPDFIQRHIFPGGMLPSPGALAQAIGRSGLVLSALAGYGPHYARTLADWRRRFRAAWPDVAELGFDERFRRLWEYYLAYCEAGFRAGFTDMVHVRLQRV